MDWLDKAIDILVIVLGGGGGAVSLITYLLNRKDAKAKSDAEAKKIEADTHSTNATTYDQMQETIGDMEKRLTVLRSERDEDRNKIDQLEADIRVLKNERLEIDAEVGRLRTIVRTYRTGVRKLIEQLRKLGVDPVWVPDDEEIK